MNEGLDVGRALAGDIADLLLEAQAMAVEFGDDELTKSIEVAFLCIARLFVSDSKIKTKPTDLCPVYLPRH